MPGEYDDEFRLAEEEKDTVRWRGSSWLSIDMQKQTNDVCNSSSDAGAPRSIKVFMRCNCRGTIPGLFEALLKNNSREKRETRLSFKGSGLGLPAKRLTQIAPADADPHPLTRDLLNFLRLRLECD